MTIISSTVATILSQNPKNPSILLDLWVNKPKWFVYKMGYQDVKVTPYDGWPTF
jgi:hypothetical protein